MKTQVENVSDVKKIIHFEIPWEQVDAHVKQAVRQISRSAKIPGFRPGKAPESLIRTRFAQHIKEDVINHLVPKAYQEALKENQFDLVSEPSLHDVLYAEGSPFFFKVTIETRPSIELKQYKGLKLTGKPIQASAEEVETLLKNYQERAAELIPQPDAPAEAGHYLSARVKATMNRDGKSQKLFEDQTLIALGSDQNHVAFNENLLGKKAGDVVEFDARYDEDHPEKSIAGKTVHYQVTVESVNDRRLAPLDDEFAKDLGDFASLDELKEKIKKDILRVKTNEQRNRWKDEILRQLIESHPFEAPEGLIKIETDSLLRNYAESLLRTGVDLENPELNWKEIQGRLSRQADQNVRASMLIETIARAENIVVAEEDMERAIADIAEHQHRAVEAVKAEIVKQEKMENLKERTLLAKTLDFLLEQADTRYENTEKEGAKNPKS